MRASCGCTRSRSSGWGGTPCMRGSVSRARSTSASGPRSPRATSRCAGGSLERALDLRRGVAGLIGRRSPRYARRLAVYRAAGSPARAGARRLVPGAALDPRAAGVSERRRTRADAPHSGRSRPLRTRHVSQVSRRGTEHERSGDIKYPLAPTSSRVPCRRRRRGSGGTTGTRTVPGANRRHERGVAQVSREPDS